MSQMMMKPTYSVGACPVGEQLGHSTRVTTFEEGNKHGHPAGSAFCVGCGQLYPAVSAQPAVAATLRALARAFNEAPRCSQTKEGSYYYFQLPLNSGQLFTSALVSVFPNNLYELDTYISPAPTDPDFFEGKPIDQRILPIAQELLKIGFLVLSLDSTNKQSLNQLVLGRPRRLHQSNDDDDEQPIAIEVCLQAI